MIDPVVQLARQHDTSDRAVIGTDSAGTVVYWGAGAEALYTWTASEVLGRNILDVTPTDLSRAEGERILEALRAGRSWSGEFVVNMKNGQRFIAFVTDMPVHDDNGMLAGMVGISRRSAYLDDLGGRQPAHLVSGREVNV